MLVETIIAAIIVSAIIYLANDKERNGILIVLVIPLLILLVMWGVSEQVRSFLVILSIVSIIAYPACFLLKKINNNTALMIYLTLLIEWDWAITWQYVQQHSVAELNLLLNTSSFLIFTIQKLSPLILFIIMFFVARNDKKLTKILDWGMATVSAFYFLLFLWTLYVMSMLNIQLVAFLAIAILAMIAVLVLILKSKK